MKVPTMATIITEINWSVAVACLPSGFVNLPIEKVLGGYLVINHKVIETDLERGIPTTKLSNFWLTEDAFQEMFGTQHVGPHRFTELRAR